MNKNITRLFTILAFLLVPTYIIWSIAGHNQKPAENSLTKNNYYITSAKNIKKGLYNKTQNTNVSVYSSTYSEKVSDSIYIINEQNKDGTTSQKIYYKNKVLPSEMKFYNPVIKFIKNQILESNIFEIGLYDVYIEKIDLNSKYINAAVMHYPFEKIESNKNSSIDGNMIVITLFVNRTKKPEEYSLLSVIKGSYSKDFFNVFLKSVYKFSIVKKGES